MTNEARSNPIYTSANENDSWDTKSFVRRLEHKIPTHPYQIALIGAGELFGDEELINNTPR
jgi:hypothetical protein